MCLDLKKNDRIKTAKSDIVVWKCLKKSSKFYMTPYQFSDVTIGSTYESNLKVIEYSDCKEVKDGLHSFKTLEDCQTELQDWIDNGYDSRVIVECVIPKGSNYYEGVFNGLVSIASNKLTYVKELK